MCMVGFAVVRSPFLTGGPARVAIYVLVNKSKLSFRFAPWVRIFYSLDLESFHSSLGASLLTN